MKMTFQRTWNIRKGGNREEWNSIVKMSIKEYIYTVLTYKKTTKCKKYLNFDPLYLGNRYWCTTQLTCITYLMCCPTHTYSNTPTNILIKAPYRLQQAHVYIYIYIYTISQRLAYVSLGWVRFMLNLVRLG